MKIIYLIFILFIQIVLCGDYIIDSKPAKNFNFKVENIPGEHIYIYTNENLIVVPTFTSGPEPFYRDIIYFSYDYGETFDTLLTWEKDLFNEPGKEDAISVEHTLIGDDLFSVTSNGNLLKINLKNKTIDTVDIPIKHKAYGFLKWDKTVLIDSYKESIALITDSTKLMLSQDLGASWKVIDLPDFRNMDTTLKIWSLDIVSDSTVIIGPADGSGDLIKAFYVTTDFGESWEYTEHYPTSGTRGGFYNSELGLFYGVAIWNQNHPDYDFTPAIFKVTELGKKYEEIYRDPDDHGFMRGSYLVDEKEWWFVSDIKIVYTYDGGITWNEIVNEPLIDDMPDDRIKDIAIDGKGQIWVCANQSVIYKVDLLNSVNDSNDIGIFRSEYYDLNGNKLDENRLPSNTAFIKVNYDKNNKIIGTDKRIIIGDW